MVESDDNTVHGSIIKYSSVLKLNFVLFLLWIEGMQSVN